MRTAVLTFTLLAQLTLGACAFAQQDPPRVAWSTPNPAYPIKVRILSSDRHNSHHSGIYDTQSYGSGNILATPAVGFDYNSNCSGGFVHNAGEGDFYQAKWKQPNAKLEILIVQTGSNHPEKCTVNVALKPAPYTRDNPPPHLVTAPTP